MKFSLILAVIFVHSLVVAIAKLLPLFQPAVLAALVIEAVAIIVWCHRSNQHFLSLGAIVGLAIAIAMEA